MVASVDDLLIEIFLRLPMKSLIRFKLVSKHWQSLISDPGFGILRNPNPNPATGLIFQADPFSSAIFVPHIISFKKDTSPQIRTLKLTDTTEIEGSCNGLLLCRIFNSCGYYVFNPTTNKHLVLPQIHDEPDFKVLRISMFLAFDPSNSKTPHYKVVCALRLESEDTETFRYKFMVYSSETGCWRKSCVEPFQVANVDFHRGVYWNGAMHWVSNTKTGKSIYFDPDDDRMSRDIMPTPPMTGPGHPPCINLTYYFGESCGHLYYTDRCCSWKVTEFVVYELRKDYSEWFVKYRIHKPSYSIAHEKPYLCSVVQGKSDEDTFSVLLIGGKLVRYNFINKTLETICQGEGVPKALLCLPLQHAESLCSV